MTKVKAAPLQTNIAISVMRRVIELGLPIPSNPTQAPPTWPSNMADLSDRELGEHLAYWTAIKGYAAFQAALLDTDRTVFKHEKVRAECVALLTAVEEPVDGKVEERRLKSAITVKKAKAALDLDVTDLEDRQTANDKLYASVVTLLQDYEQRYNTISREISRRSSERAKGMT